MIEDSLHGTIPNSRETEGGGVCFWETREFVTSQYAPLDNCHGAGPPSIRTNQRAAFARVCRGLGKYYVFFHPYWPHSLCSCSGLYSVSWSVLQIVRVCYARFDDHISFVQCKSASYNMGMRSNITSDTIREHCKELQLTDAQIREMMNRLLEDIQLGLGKDTHETSIVKCFVTYVQDLPNGTERGKFLALDLGGTNFRVLLIFLGEKKHFDMKSKIYAIPQSIMLGSGTQLFDHIAECLANFMKEHNVGEQRLPLGFTFSFPLTQKGLTKGILERWTKGFDCSGCIGEDVVQLLKDALSRRNDVQIDVCAILNDTTGTLMSCAWLNFNCKIGLIVGTGSNACYVERVENAELFDGDRSKPYVLINTEWGAFGDDGRLDIVRTEYDREIDQHSINPGKQLHEKMISGMYMGELARLIIVKFTKQGLLFGGKGSDLLFKRGNFFTKYVSEIESDKRGSYVNCRQVLDELGLSHATDQDCSNVRYICECVSIRAAHLVSAGVATLINKMGQENVTVGIDGSVYRFHPHFHDLMSEKIAQLVTPGIKFDLMLSEDGSGRGAALVAAVACRDR